LRRYLRTPARNYLPVDIGALHDLSGLEFAEIIGGALFLWVWVS
jgi:hypothetical protein